MTLPPGVRIVSGRYYRVVYVGIVNGRRKQKVVALTRVSEGSAALYRALATFEKTRGQLNTTIPARIDEWLAQLDGLSDAERRETKRMAAEISRMLREFTTPQVEAKHILQILQKWSKAGKLRTTQRYRGLLNKFFKWVIVQGDRRDNPVAPVPIKAPRPRTRYLTDEEFKAIRGKLLGDDTHKTASGVMMQVYVDLLYLTGQRGQDVRLLQWQQIGDGMIRFKPSKTRHSAGTEVDIPVTPAIAEVLARAKEWMRGRRETSPYVVHNLQGEPYTAHGVGTAWERARERAGVKNATLKDLRAKHATDARRMGYAVEEISEGLAHADVKLSRVYLKDRLSKIGRVELELPG